MTNSLKYLKVAFVLAWIGLAGLLCWTIESNIENDQKVCSDCSGYEDTAFLCIINTTDPNCLRLGCYNDCAVYPTFRPNLCLPYLCNSTSESMASTIITCFYGCILLACTLYILCFGCKTCESADKTPLLNNNV